MEFSFHFNSAVLVHNIISYAFELGTSFEFVWKIGIFIRFSRKISVSHTNSKEVQSSKKFLAKKTRIIFSNWFEKLKCLDGKMNETHRTMTLFVVVFTIDWESKTVLEFVRKAPNLTYFDFWSGLDSNYEIPPQFIRELATARKSSVNRTMEPLNLNMYAMDCQLKEVGSLKNVAASFQSY